jgi:tellurite resistance protein
MGLYKKTEESRSRRMENMDLTGPEAGIALSTLVAFSDDNPSEVEAAVMRKYYKYEDAESFQKKMEDAGLKFPENFAELEPKILETLGTQTKEFQLRTLAAALVLAHSDGVFDQNEMTVLNRFCLNLKLSLHDADLFSKHRLKEIDEVTGYNDFRGDDYTNAISELNINFTIEEAGAALAILVGLSDDDPSDEEAGVMREYYSVQVVSSLMSKIVDSGNAYPEALPSTKESIYKALNKADRDLQKKHLAIAYKVAGADGVFDNAELMLIEEYCEEYGIGLVELKDYFKADMS